MDIKGVTEAIVASESNLAGSTFRMCKLNALHVDDAVAADARFENVNLFGATFTRMNMSQATFDDGMLPGATFHNVNMAGAKFDDVSLKCASVTNVDLSGVHISHCNTSDMRIEGILVSELLAAYRRACA